MATNKLKKIQVKQAKAGEKPYKLLDGDGMYLLVDTKGGRYWRMDYALPTSGRRWRAVLEPCGDYRSPLEFGMNSPDERQHLTVGHLLAPYPRHLA